MGKKILIVEDEKAIANALTLKLRSAGFEIFLAQDGETAVSTLQKFPFDLIILDLILPKKDGFFVLEEIKKLKIPTPVIVASNLGQKEDINLAKELGAKDYIIKAEITLAEITEKVKKILGL